MEQSYRFDCDSMYRCIYSHALLAVTKRSQVLDQAEMMHVVQFSCFLLTVDLFVIMSHHLVPECDHDVRAPLEMAATFHETAVGLQLSARSCNVYKSGFRLCTA